MMIAIGCDHAGCEMKKAIIDALSEKGFEFKDMGCNGEKCDYPDIAEAVCGEITSGSCEKGILVCGTGIGMSIAANKIPGIRCALLSDLMSARLTREHNDTNMMAIGAGVVGEMLALEILDTWLDTEFSHSERHQRRIDKVMALEK